MRFRFDIFVLLNFVGIHLSFKIPCHDLLISLSPVVVWMDRRASVIGAPDTHFSNIPSITNLEGNEHPVRAKLNGGGH